MSLSRKDIHSWFRISHGSNKFVMNLNTNEREIPEVQIEESSIKLNANDFAFSFIEGKTKTTKKRTSWLFTKNRSF